LENDATNLENQPRQKRPISIKRGDVQSVRGWLLTTVVRFKTEYSWLSFFVWERASIEKVGLRARTEEFDGP